MVISVLCVALVQLNLILKIHYTDNTTQQKNSLKVNDEHNILIIKNNHMYRVLQCEENDILVPVLVINKLLT